MADFVIVVEVCNKRAHLAYLKGVDDLDKNWETFRAYAIKIDAESREKDLEKERDFSIEAEKFKKSMDDYHKKLAAWDRSLFFKGRKPAPPFVLPPTRSAFFSESMLMIYERMRQDLKRCADLAGVAISPYRMTERQALEMVSWEDGSKIARLLETASKKDEEHLYVP